MIRDYFGRLMGEAADHPHVPVTDTSEQAQKARRDHESAQREAIGKMKQFAAWFTHGVPNGAHLRRAIFEAKRADGVMDEVDRFFAARLDRAGQDVAVPEDGPSVEEELAAAPAAWG